MDRYCWFCGQKITETYGFTVKCPNGHVWHTDGADSPNEPLVLVYGWGETNTGKPISEDVDASPPTPTDGRPTWPLRKANTVESLSQRLDAVEKALFLLSVDRQQANAQ